MIKIAVTGGICSGKSTVCKYIEELGYQVYYSDNIALDLANYNKDLQKEIIKEFGELSFIDGDYNRRYIANIVFNDDKSLTKLNKIFKPYLSENLKQIYNNDDEIIFYETALLFEHNRQKEFDIIFNVYADKELIISRLKKRNNFTDIEIENRLKSQIDPQIKINKSDFIINTSDNVDWTRRLKLYMKNLLNSKYSKEYIYHNLALFV